MSSQISYLSAIVTFPRQAALEAVAKKPPPGRESDVATASGHHAEPDKAEAEQCKARRFRCSDRRRRDHGVEARRAFQREVRGLAISNAATAEINRTLVLRRP